jgi:hypothetical protein
MVEDAPDSESRTVWVRRQWNDSLRAEYRLSDLTRLHWSDFSGGVGARSNRPYVHGYVECDQMLRGDLSHSCSHGPPPHRVKVCVVAKDNGGSGSALMKQLKEAASRRVR